MISTRVADCVAGIVVVLSAALAASVGHAQTETIRVDLTLRTGGELGGLVVDHTSHGIVIVDNTTPYVFSWGEIKTPSAYGAMRDLKVLERGGIENLAAEDHFQLGQFALSRGRTELAAREFNQAKRIDESYAPRVRKAFERYREKREQRKKAPRAYEKPLVEENPGEANGARETPGLSERVDAELARLDGSFLAAGPSPQTRARVLAVYKSFGETVRRVISEEITLLETDHFLIWTDWPKLRRGVLIQWCEAMYEALCEQFGLDPSQTVFLAKCPVFCWRSKMRFLKFARQFDNYDGTGAIGYTRSIEKNGHVHMVLLKQGRSEADFDRFACTLVHEGTHAFLHRLYSTRLIPHWVNEGYADLVAERVLGDRCPNAENAALLARQYARYDWPINELLESVGPIGVHLYPLAHSVVQYLEGLGHKRFAAFIRSLKGGRTVAEALAENYDGLTLDQLEARWRSTIRAAEKQADLPGGEVPATVVGW